MRPLDLRSVRLKGNALIIIPPFAEIARPALGPHILQACAREAGFDVCVLYANLLLAEEIGAKNYRAVCYAHTSLLLGERFFAATAYGLPPLGRRCPEGPSRADGRYPALSPHELRQLETAAARWVDNLVAELLELDFPIVGCSTTFYQTAASVAVLRRLKRLRPGLVTILGGANCEGEMAEGILSLQAGIDYVFSGESEVTFPRFLRDLRAGQRPQTPIVHGEACRNLDALPTPDFTEYYEQRHLWLSDDTATANEDLWLPYESSRGCWWGQKHHCTFCGLNGQTMAFRAKSADRVLSDLKQLLAKHPSNKVSMVDNIMPHPYFRDFLPRLGSELPGLHLFYEQKANLSLGQVLTLKRAGVAVIQPGIEALNSSLLKRMDKGVSATQNLTLLRYARAADLKVTWNLLYAFPGDEAEEYEQTLALLPLLHHLAPPSGVFPLSLDRFSPYFVKPEKYGVRNLRPWPGYADVLPDEADVAKVAYHFEGDYASGSRERPDLFNRLQEEITAWRRAWQADEPPPVLAVLPLTEEEYLLHDTRALPGTQQLTFLTRAQACLVLTGPRRQGTTPAEIAWALECKLLVELDGGYVPLATADPDVLQEFEAEVRRQAAGPARMGLEVLPPLPVCA